ncbi:fused MFS/spermidine synthase [Sphingomonas sp. 1P06PA]|uniref:spermidine synthase n=1 Tax=Sphingomonas sp. 1P06PA TaxID=554121 RepID=UPI0039A6E11D
MSEAPVAAETDRRARALFIATILSGSFLLFLMQPLVARMALPRVGGAPAVWNSAMLVYQALLLAGYGYAHVVGRLTPRLQAGVHIALLAVAALWLPIALPAMTMPATARPELWVPWLLLTTIGPLFLAVSAQAPLMQRWFALGWPQANPYALYAASNLGSFAGLIAYPLLLEPTLALAAQSRVWAILYAVLLLLVILCARTLPQVAPAEAHHEATPAPTVRQWLRWIALAAVPSGLMLSTTTHLTTDIVAMPLVWVTPLGLYLLSFTIAFSNRQRPARIIAWAFPIAVIVAAAMAFRSTTNSPFAAAALGLAVLLIISVTLHNELYRRRPDAAHLTAFYLAMAIGGVLGGVFCAILAPVLFDWAYEHPLLLVAAAAIARCRPVVPLLDRFWRDPRSARIGLITIVAAVLLFWLVSTGLVIVVPDWARQAAVAMLCVLALLSVGRRMLFTLCVAAAALANGGTDGIRISTELDARTRSYFGIYTVIDRPRTRELVHGTTLHGVQSRVPGQEYRPASYYAPGSGVGMAMTDAPRLFGPHARIGVVGLGAGTLACYSRPGQEWRFYEIDPAVVRIASDPGKFTYLQHCLPRPDIRIGDARLTLAEQGHAPHDLLVIDAFSSDAVPMHLLTTEAFAVYGATLSPDGLLLVHISNRFLDLEPVLAAAARAGRWRAALRDHEPDAAEAAAGATRSVWVAFSQSAMTMDQLTTRGGTRVGDWQSLDQRPGFVAWTDDYGSILPLLRRR